MPRPIWTGAVSFGLVTIPIKIVTATESHHINFHLIHLADGGRVRNRKVCEIDGKVLRDDEIGKGYEISKDQVIEITDEDLNDMPLPTAKAIEIVAFVDRDSIDPVRISDSYYLAADGAVAAKPYVLLRRALERSSKAAIAKFALRGRERLGLLSLRGDAMVLHSMKWPDEIRDPSELAPPEMDLDEGEIERAMQLMDSMTAEDISEYRDHYRDALEELLAAKSEGKAPPAVEEEERPAGKVLDLMAALEESVQAARHSRGERAEGEHATVHDLPKSAAKKSAATKRAAGKSAAKTTTSAKKKTTTKKTTTKKTAAKKTAAKRPRSA